MVNETRRVTSSVILRFCHWNLPFNKFCVHYVELPMDCPTSFFTLSCVMMIVSNVNFCKFQILKSSSGLNFRFFMYESSAKKLIEKPFAWRKMVVHSFHQNQNCSIPVFLMHLFAVLLVNIEYHFILFILFSFL